VDLYLRDWEDRLRAEGFEPGNRHSHELLRRWAPAHALARSWCAEPRRAVAEQEVERLQRLVREAVRLLEAAGDVRGARRIERGLRGNRYAGLPIRSVTSTVRRPTGIVEYSVGLLDRLQYNHA
jgi:hypothetical protein